MLRALTARTDNKKFGIYLHFLDENTGGLPDYSRTKYPYELQASTVDHALLQAGAMTAAEYFGGDVAAAAAPIVNDADWQAMFDDKAGYMTMGWKASTAAWTWLGRATIPDSTGNGAATKSGSSISSRSEQPTEHAVEPAVYYQLQSHRETARRHAAVRRLLERLAVHLFLQPLLDRLSTPRRRRPARSSAKKGRPSIGSRIRGGPRSRIAHAASR